MNAITPRSVLSYMFGQLFDGKRDLYRTYGYRDVVTYEEMLERYKRQDIVSRIVNAYPDAVWTKPPRILENQELAKALVTLDERVHLYHYLNRADRLAGLGKYAVLLLGFDDVEDSDGLLEPAALDGQPGGGLELVYVQAYGEGDAKIVEYEDDPSDPSFGMPRYYDLRVRQTERATKTLRVHSSRVLHIADSPVVSDVEGYPIIQRVFNRLDDLEKVVGGASEVFWLNSRKGMQLDLDKEAQVTEEDTKRLNKEVQDYVHGLTRILRTRGVNIKELGGVGVNPEPVFNVIMSVISTTTGIPQRIFIGSEQGKLASEQDRANWAIRINERRVLFAEPRVIRPMMMRLQDAGVLPGGTYRIEWPEAFQLSPLERAQTAAQQARAATNLSRTMADMPDLVSREEARSIIFARGELKGEAAIEGETVGTVDG